MEKLLTTYDREYYPNAFGNSRVNVKKRLFKLHYLREFEVIYYNIKSLYRVVYRSEYHNIVVFSAVTNAISIDYFKPD